MQLGAFATGLAVRAPAAPFYRRRGIAMVTGFRAAIDAEGPASFARR